MKNSEEKKEAHRLGTINKWDAPDGDWATEYDWTRSRGPAPWPVPGGWVFKDAEGGGWWQYYGEAGVGHHTDHSVREAFEDDDSIEDPYEALGDVRGDYAYLNADTANPEEVSYRSAEDEELKWSLEVAGTDVFCRVEPDRTDLMASVAQALAAYHDDSLDEQVEDIVPASGRKTDEAREQEAIERHQKENASLMNFSDEEG